MRTKRSEIDTLIAEHAWPAQDFIRPSKGAASGIRTRTLGAQALQTGQQLAIELQLFGTGGCRIEGQAAFDLATRQAGGKHLARKGISSARKSSVTRKERNRNSGN